MSWYEKGLVELGLGEEEGSWNGREGVEWKEEEGKGKDNAAAIKLSQLTPRIKRHEGWTVGNVTKLLEYFAPLFWRIKRGPSLTTTVP